MKKTATKTRTKASKKTAKVTRRAPAAQSSTSFWHRYHRERDDFFRTHPNANWLLGVFILVFLGYIGLMMWNTGLLYAFGL